MRNRILPSLMIAAVLTPGVLFVSGCDREVSHKETVKENADGTSSKSETTVTEKPNGAMEKTSEKSVDNTVH